MATLKDIAKAAGVSISTASRALKNSASISAETRKTVQEVAYKVNYRSKRIASSEVITQKSVIAVIVPQISNPYYSTLVSGIQDAAVMQQYSIMLFSTERDSASEKKAVDMILSMDVAGVIIAPPETEQTNCEKLHEAQLPVIDAGYRPSSCEFPYSAVVPDDYTGAILATEYLVYCGMKSILLFTGPSETHSARNRVNGYLEVIRRSNLAPNIFSGPFTYHAGYQMALDLFGKSGVSPAEA
ncbi:MAG: LacI family DNA-binding transcriptional regulator, partial [Bacillota bacterium]|nr:LacI family DNA-binding transcriptional regulator [Bacillota bacterium]